MRKIALFVRLTERLQEAT